MLIICSCHKIMHKTRINIVLHILCLLLKPQIVKLLRKPLPTLSSGFRKQNVDIFSFGEYDEGAPHAIAGMPLTRQMISP